MAGCNGADGYLVGITLTPNSGILPIEGAPTSRKGQTETSMHRTCVCFTQTLNSDTMETAQRTRYTPMDIRDVALG
ncbi:hypothetical protein NDU88_007074 [Pleurodeles waltl]|uniref:Uncharacterized protein n=1 Tax=Pleurodeles waltl TaxID=8319 RepID=A0AAV7RP96_PLEWA|nr:hypothetical protein NDU88_007074 [Pleurodeles waltl]